MVSHEVLGGKIQMYRRNNSRFWQCSASVGGKQRRTSTKEESFALAKQIPQDWYLTLNGKDRAGLPEPILEYWQRHARLIISHF